MATATTMKVSSATSASTFCTGAGIIATMTSMRSCRPDHATTPLPRNTQPTMRKSMISSAQKIEVLKK